MNNNIIISNNATIKSIGEHTGGNCKPVVCITDNMTFNSITDAAEYYHTWATRISNVCTGKFRTHCGKRFCFLHDINQHLDEMMDNSRSTTEKLHELERKAALWDAFQLEQEKKRKAEEARNVAITKLKTKLERRKRIVERIDIELQAAVHRMIETEEELKKLKGDEN